MVAVGENEEEQQKNGQKCDKVTIVFYVAQTESFTLYQVSVVSERERGRDQERVTLHFFHTIIFEHVYNINFIFVCCRVLCSMLFVTFDRLGLHRKNLQTLTHSHVYYFISICVNFDDSAFIPYGIDGVR